MWFLRFQAFHQTEELGKMSICKSELGKMSDFERKHFWTISAKTAAD